MKYIKRHNLIHENNRSGRSEGVSLEELVSIFEENCSDYNYKSPIIYRGIKNSRGLGEYATISPKNYKREGGYSNTTYLNLIDGSESWEDYPKRRESIICSTSRITARSFGEVYVLIPFNGAKFGVCPSYDFQQSFNDFSSMFGFPLYRMNEFLEVKEHGGISYEEIRRKVINKDYNEVELSFAYRQYISDNNINGEQIFNHMLELTSPDRNDFKIRSQSEIESGDNLGYEVWTNSNCLLIKAHYYRTFLREIGIDEEFVSNLLV